MNQFSSDVIRNIVRGRYANIAMKNKNNCGCNQNSSCCDNSQTSTDQYSHDLGYSRKEVNDVPEGSNMGLGCGNPQVIASLQPGETVLDLGSGGGFDCFLAAKAVGSSGHVIGVDMTPEMLNRARENAKKGAYNNVEFRLGEIEHLPVADDSVDIIMSNCVINLSPEKNKVYSDAFRVLRPGGRLAISDVVALKELPDEFKKNPEMLCDCVGGAETVQKIEQILVQVGFVNIDIRVHGESRQFMENWFPENNPNTYVASASIKAIKPLS